MKSIAYVSSSKIPSKEANSIHVMKMAQAFSLHGMEVALIAPKNTVRNKKVKEIFGCYGVEPLFRIVWLTSVYTRLGAVFYGFLSAIYCKINGFDLVYCRNLLGCFFAVMINNKVILELHQPIYRTERLKSFFLESILRSSGLKKVVVITNSLKEYYSQEYPRSSPYLLVFPDGADKAKGVSCSPSPVRIRKGKFNVGYVGSLYHGKGMEVVLGVAPLCPWAQFHVVGGSEAEVNLWSEKSKGIDNVIFYGHVDHAFVEDILTDFDVLVLPNQEKVGTSSSKGKDIGQWTSPLKLFEYMSAKKCIVASDLPVLREVLAHGENALLCPPKDYEAWARAFEILRDDLSLRDKIANNGFEDFDKNYSWFSRAGRILDSLSK